MMGMIKNQKLMRCDRLMVTPSNPRHHWDEPKCVNGASCDFQTLPKRPYPLFSFYILFDQNKRSQ